MAISISTALTTAIRRVFISVRRVSASRSRCSASWRSASSRASRSWRRSRLARTTLHSTSCVSSTRRTSSRSSMRSRRRSTSFASASGAAPGGRQRLDDALLGQALAVAGLGEQLVLDHAPHAGAAGPPARARRTPSRMVSREPGEQVGRDLRRALGDAYVVELAAHQAQQRRLDLGVGQLGTARDEPHDRLRDLLRHQPAARLHHRAQRLRARHAREAHAVLRDRGHRALEALEVREVVLAQRDQDAVVGARKIEIVGGGLVLLEALLERERRPVLDEVGEVLEEFPCAQPPAVVGLRQREDLLELVEDQQRQQRAPARVAQQVAAMVQELPQRLAVDRRARARPVADGNGGLEDRLLDLLGGRRRLGRVVHAHVHRAITLAAQPRHEARPAAARSCRGRTGRTAP